MNSDSVSEENVKFVLARLRLAQALLEESDALPGFTGYGLQSEKGWRMHPRHEREALVNYLLLTCFDRLGQERGFTTFQDWLKSKRTEHACERQQVLQAVEVTSSPLELATALADQYRSLYGVRNSFFRGIESLSDDLQKKLLESIIITFDPIYGTHGPNAVVTPTNPLDNDVLERSLKLKYLFEKRNRFTHRLEQFYVGSTPLGSFRENGPSWRAVIEDSRLSYLSANQEIVHLATGGAYVYSSCWPFALFETLHVAVGSTFHRTDIKLRFEIQLYNSKVPGIVITVEVGHDQLKDFRALESQLWELHANGDLPQWQQKFRK